ncbi:MAG: hypothetical protein MJ245_00675 [Clostridia bacterium]|nr:hypothetical protein [Clostridia bacterium]
MGRKVERILKDTLITILVLVIGLVIYLYAREGRLSFGTLRDDFKEAVDLKQARIDERINYNPIEPEQLIQKLKDKGLVVGNPESLGTNNLGAKKAYKFNVEGRYINFYIIDWDDKNNEDMLNTKAQVEKDGKVYIEGKYYDAYVNQTALIAKVEGNPKEEMIIKEFKNIVGLSYDEMVEKRGENKLNPSETVVDKVLDDFTAAVK